MMEKMTEMQKKNHMSTILMYAVSGSAAETWLNSVYSTSRVVKVMMARTCRAKTGVRGEDRCKGLSLKVGGRCLWN